MENSQIRVKFDFFYAKTYNIRHRKREKNKYFMKNVEDDVNLSKNEYYDSIISNEDDLKNFIAKRGDFEVIKLYRYALVKVKALSVDVEKNASLISVYWKASDLLQKTDALQKFLRGEITVADIDRFDAEQEEINRQIVERIELKQKDKNRIIKSYSPLGQKIERLKVVAKEFFNTKVLRKR